MPYCGKKYEAETEEINQKVWVERISASTDFEVLKNWNLFDKLLLMRKPQTAPIPRAADD
jgi:hypothetical protein